MSARLRIGVVLFLAVGPGLAEDAAVERGEGIAQGENGSDQTACVQCHGEGGEGDPAAGYPRLAGMSAEYLEKQMRDFTTDERPSSIMEPIAEALSEEDWRDVARYYARLEVPEPDSDSAAESGMLERGQTIAERGLDKAEVQACVNCHGPAGTGLPPHFPALAGQHASYLEQELRDWKSGERSNAPAGMMNEVAERLSEEDIEAVSRYFASVNPAEARH